MRLAATGRRGPRDAAAVGRGGRGRSRRRRARPRLARRHARRRRARVGLVPGADAPGARPPCPRRSSRRPHEPHGQRRRRATIESAPLTTLLDVLREELGVTSPKAGCEQGGCGACTVLVDGEPQRACLTAGRRDRRAARSRRSRGSARRSRSRPLQQAFTHHYAAQCGFCTSGMLHGGRGVHRSAAGPTTARRSRRRSPATSAAAPAT